MKLRKKSFFTLSVSILPFIICSFFFLAYSTLSIIRHNHYQSFGFDLGINDQVVWQYSHFQAPITTIDHKVFSSKLAIHIELIYALLAPFYWVWSDPRMLLLLQAAFVCYSGLAIYLLAKRYQLHPWLQIAVLLTYLLFYGVQNALWFDAHSATFAIALVAWFIYFLVSQKNKCAAVLFLLAITSKENIAGITFLISVVYLIVSRKKSGFVFAVISLVYLYLVFDIYFPFFVKGGYPFANPQGLLSNLNPHLMINTADKRQVYFYTLLSYGFLPLLNPIYLIPAIGDLASYFVLAATSVPTAQGLFLQYRIDLVPLMSWATIAVIARFHVLNRKMIAVYLVLCVLAVQYLLHLPLSYLTKQWFWQEPSGVENINTIIGYLPQNTSVVTQDNIVPHVSERSEVYFLWPETRGFKTNSPCGKSTCNWFRWAGNPEYLIVDTSPEWNTLHLSENRDIFIEAIHAIEKAGVVTIDKKAGNAILFKINKNPSMYQ